jgi:hypothetical protein
MATHSALFSNSFGKPSGMLRISSKARALSSSRSCSVSAINNTGLTMIKVKSPIITRIKVVASAAIVPRGHMLFNGV